MPNIVFVTLDGRRQIVNAAIGETVREAALNNNLAEIIGECGGCLSCATCHVYVDEEWFDRLSPIGNDEDAMLDGTYCERQPNSRLCCQIKVSPVLDGLVIRLPERQI